MRYQQSVPPYFEPCWSPTLLIKEGCCYFYYELASVSQLIAHVHLGSTHTLAMFSYPCLLYEVLLKNRLCRHRDQGSNHCFDTHQLCELGKLLYLCSLICRAQIIILASQVYHIDQILCVMSIQQDLNVKINHCKGGGEQVSLMLWMKTSLEVKSKFVALVTVKYLKLFHITINLIPHYFSFKIEVSGLNLNLSPYQYFHLTAPFLYCSVYLFR